MSSPLLAILALCLAVSSVQAKGVAKSPIFKVRAMSALTAAATYDCPDSEASPRKCSMDVNVGPDDPKSPDYDPAHPCVADVPYGTLHLVGPTLSKIVWTIRKKSTATGTFKFDYAYGIKVLDDADGQTYAPDSGAGLQEYWVWHRVRHYAGRMSEVKYEPRVWWSKNGRAPWTTCRPIDPRIVND